MCCCPSQQLSSCSSCRQGCHPQPAVPEHSYNYQDMPRLQIWFPLKAQKCLEGCYCHVLPPSCPLHYVTSTGCMLRLRSETWIKYIASFPHRGVTLVTVTSLVRWDDRCNARFCNECLCNLPVQYIYGHLQWLYSLSTKITTDIFINVGCSLHYIIWS